MNTVGQKEIKTQEKVRNFFLDTPGYRYLGHWKGCFRKPNLQENVPLLHLTTRIMVI